VDEALRRNADMAVAALSVKQAPLAAELADNDRWPVPSASLSSSLSGRSTTPAPAARPTAPAWA
jgi:outer membrane protein TolC